MLLAEKQAEETRIAAEAERVRAAVEAEAQRLLNEAENVLTDQARYSLFRRKLLDRIEGIVRESVKPMEKIEGIRILQVDGLNGGGGGGNGGRSATDEVIDSALRYRVQAPLIDSLLADIGVEGGSLAKMPGLIREARDMQGIRKDSARKGGGDKPRLAAAASAEPPTERGPRKKELRRAMARVYVSTVVNARNDRVWARVRDFNGLPNWHPAIAESRIEGGEPSDKIGCVRDFRLRNGDRIREKLLGLSDYDMFCTYSILEFADGRRELRRDAAADAGHRRRPDLPGMDRRVRLRARARDRARRQYRRRRVPGRLRRAEARVRRLAVPHIVKSTILDAPTDAVWDVLRDFNGHDRWHPAVATAPIERAQASDKIGCVRRFKLKDGSELREQLLALSDLEQTFSYCLLDTPIPMFNYVAHVRLLPVTDGDRTFWHWESRFTTRPEDAERLTEMVAEADLSGRLRCHPPASEARPHERGGSSMPVTVKTFASPARRRRRCRRTAARAISAAARW